MASLSDTISTLAAQVSAARAEKEETDREQEDLLVLLEDLSIKRKQDKRRMRIALLEVSEDEDGDEDEEVEVEPEVEAKVEPPRREDEITVHHFSPTQNHYEAQEPIRSTKDEQTYGGHAENNQESRKEEYVYGEESAVFRGGEYDAEPFEATVTETHDEGATGWSPDGYEYSPHHHQNSLT